jgi:ribosomal-protein-alanine N-acetyltransferase
MILLAHSAHAAAMALIHSQAFPPSEAWSEGDFAIQLSLPGGFGLVTDGGCLLARALGDEAEVLTLAVLPEKRRQGVGRGLLAATLQEAAKRQVVSLFLEVAESNVAARALYAAFAAKPIGRRRAYYPDGGDALLLRIVLP